MLAAPYQAASMSLSLVSLAHASSRTYYLQRTPTLSDSNPSVKYVLPAFLLFLPVTATFLITWALFFAHIPLAALFMVSATLCVNAFFIVFFRIGKEQVPQMSSR